MAQSKLNLRLDYSLYGTHAAFYLGVDSGLYKAEGIELTIAEGSGSGTTARLLAQGTDPVGSSISARWPRASDQACRSRRFWAFTSARR